MDLVVRAPHYLRIETSVRTAVAALALLALTIAGAGAWGVTSSHRARAERQARCAAELRALKQRNPFIARYLLPVDACLAYEHITGVRL